MYGGNSQPNIKVRMKKLSFTGAEFHRFLPESALFVQHGFVLRGAVLLSMCRTCAVLPPYSAAFCFRSGKGFSVERGGRLRYMF